MTFLQGIKWTFTVEGTQHSIELIPLTNVKGKDALLKYSVEDNEQMIAELLLGDDMKNKVTDLSSEILRVAMVAAGKG